MLSMAQARCALFMVAALAAPSFAGVAGAQRCVVDLAVLNKNRTVSGDISAECPGNIFHSAPFGNWGVELDSIIGGPRRDGFQFSGWKPGDGWLQWNSCTTHQRFAPGNDQYYNHDGLQSQRHGQVSRT